jgi:hypothetical protein
MLIKYGGGIVDARGSMAGNVFSRNRYGAYVRARTTPVNPQSGRQSAIRAIVSLVSAAWLGTLSQANRDAWGVFASNVPATNKLGEVINLSGFNQFVRSNVANLNVGGSLISAGPVIFTLPGEDTSYATAVDAGTGKITVTFDDTRDWCDEDDAYLIVQAGIPVNASVEFFDGPWRHAGSIEGDSVAAPTSPDATIDYPYEIADDQKVFTRAKIMRADGRISDWFRDDSIVATA